MIVSSVPAGERHRLLATSDLSEDSDLGLETAAGWAAATGAELHLFHCVNEPAFPFWSGPVDQVTRDQWLSSARTDLEWQANRVLGEKSAAGIASIEMAIGEPAVEISAYANRLGVDAIVVGPHRSRAAFDDILGTTADRLIRSAEVPCLVSNRPLKPCPGQVLFPVDFSVPSNHAVTTGMKFLGPLMAAHPESEPPLVVEFLFVSAYAAAYPRSFAIEPRLAEVVEKARQQVPDGARVRILPRILSAPLPVDGIQRAAERMDADLIVIGTHGYGMLGRTLIGSVASAVSRTVPYTTLIVPPPPQAGA